MMCRFPDFQNIIGNEWYDRESETKVNCVSDPSVQPLEVFLPVLLYEKWPLPILALRFPYY